MRAIAATTPRGARSAAWLVGAGLAGACLAAAAPARADVTSTVGGAEVDWSAGVVRARGIGPADRHAPAPAVARDAARVRAEAAARAALAAAAPGLPGAAITGDAATARLAAAIARAPVAAMDLGTDGSVTVTIALPIEAVRAAAAGPRRAVAGDAAAPEVVIVDARGAHVAPAVGIGLRGAGGAAGDAWRGATLFVDAAPADGAALVGAHPRRVRATSAQGGELVLDGAAPAPGALAVVVIGGRS